MKIPPSFLIVASGLAAAVNALHGADASTLLKRGEYLVNDVGMCADCHSPRDQRGEFVRAQWLQGAALGFAPTVPMPAWGAVAPAIAGLPSMTDEQAATFLSTGLKPTGTAARPPMPAYRFNADDARAIAAYLRSLARPATTASSATTAQPAPVSGVTPAASAQPVKKS